MSRLILLIILATWLTGVWLLQTGQLQPPAGGRPGAAGLALFASGYVTLLFGVALACLKLARRVPLDNATRSARLYGRIAHLARWMIPAWLAFGILGPPAWVHHVTARTGLEYQFLPLLVGTAPALLAWALLYLAEYPAERAIREQHVLDDLDRGLPVHAVPPLRRHALNLVRQQLLPIVVPVMMIAAVRDVVALLVRDPGKADWAMLPAALVVYLVAPTLFRVLLDAHPLPPSALRDRLDGLCRRAGLRYRDILLWRTDHTVANALVVGLLPRWRYVMLSDRLLETMDDRQVEAVFAHELGHIVHHHMGWLLLFFSALILGSMGPLNFLDEWVAGRFARGSAMASAISAAYAAVVFAATLGMMGMLSRRLERQADVFAARMLDAELAGPPPGDAAAAAAEAAGFIPAPALAWPVGPAGAALFADALRRVADVNNIRLDEWDLLHPSIRRRMLYLAELSEDPARTAAFDRLMRRLYQGMLLAVVVAVGLAVAGSFA